MGIVTFSQSLKEESNNNKVCPIRLRRSNFRHRIVKSLLYIHLHKLFNIYSFQLTKEDTSRHISNLYDMVKLYMLVNNHRVKEDFHRHILKFPS